MSAFETLMNDGFCVIHKSVSSEVCRTALAAIDRFKTRHSALVAPNADSFGHLYRVVNLHLALDELTAVFVGNVRGLEVCDQFFGSPAALYTSLYYERGSEQDLHRDTPYFCTKPAGKYLGVWLALDDVDDGNGPLRVVPGSHALPPLDVRAMARKLFTDLDNIPSASPEGWTCYQTAVQQQCRDYGLADHAVHVRAGDVVIWHPELLHGGAPHVAAERSRRSLVTHVTPVGVPVYHMDVFFDPAKKVPRKARWSYSKRDGRRIAQLGQVDFGHQYARPASELR